jgi:hypothetical protein
VLELAERLSADGIMVVLDKWDLKEGQDKHKFMEQMVHDPNITKVLVICDRGYQSKADDRKGGVGTESQLISKEVYENTAQEEFIPIVREYDENGNPCIPHFMGSRIYIDLSSDENFEENYQKLIRNLYGKPLLKRPPVGTPPSFITDEEPIQLRTTRKLGAIKDALLNERKSASGLIADFLDTFIASLEEFPVADARVAGFDDGVVGTIEKMLPLRDDFIDFAFTLFKYSTPDLDRLHEFFEKLLSFTFRRETAQSWTEVDYDSFRFFNYELMLYLIAILLQQKKFSEAAYFIHSQYFYRSDTGQLKQNSIVMFNRYVSSLDEFRKQRLKLNRVSVTADLIKARATRKDIRFEDIRETDLILHYLMELRGERSGWFPRTSVYGGRGSGIELFERMVSKRYFESVKPLFAVGTVDELKALVQKYIEGRQAGGRQYTGFMFEYDIMPIENVIDAQKIATTN